VQYRESGTVIEEKLCDVRFCVLCEFSKDCCALESVLRSTAVSSALDVLF
jgi:hypothetical protein